MPPLFTVNPATDFLLPEFLHTFAAAGRRETIGAGAQEFRQGPCLAKDLELLADFALLWRFCVVCVAVHFG